MTKQVTNARLLDVARQAALAAGEQIREMFAGPRQIAEKGPRDLVTDADLAAQKTITSIIGDAFPDHAFLTEEEDDSLAQEGPIIWVIDPIDGTTNYSRGVPIFCVSIAALHNGPKLDVNQVLAAVIYDPMLEEMFTAMPGAPPLLEDQLLHGRLLQTSSVETLAAALIGVDWPLESEQGRQMVDLVTDLAYDVGVFRTLGSAALSMAWVAAGRLDAYMNYRLKPWDVAAASLIVKQAGGSVHNLAGEPLVFDAAGSSVLLTNGRLLDELAS